MPSIRAQLYHNLSLMLEAGMPLLRSIETAAASLKGPLPRSVARLAKGISAGNTLNESMAEDKKAFPLLDIMIVEAAELSGNLPESLKLLSNWYDFRYRIKNIIVSGMMLPFLIFHAAALISPLPALFLGGWQIFNYIKDVLLILSLLYIPTIIILIILYLTPKQGFIRILFDTFTLKIPILGKAIRYLALSRYCRAFHMQYKAGIPIVRCAELSASLTGNAAMGLMLKGGSASAQSGESVSAGFSRNLPLDFLNLWLVGEESGSLDNVTHRIAENYAQSAELMFTELARWFPRFIYAIVSIIMIYEIFKGFAATGYI